MAQERAAAVENPSIFNSRLFRGGVVVAVVGALVNSAELMVMGVVAVGASWVIKDGPVAKR